MSEQPQPTIQVKQLGPFEVWLDGRPVPAKAWKGRKNPLLLSRLLLERGQPLSVDRLLDDLFPGHDYDKAWKNLRSRIGDVRRVLEPGLKKASDSKYVARSSKGMYAFAGDDACWVDVEAFEQACKRGKRAFAREQWAEARDQFQAALALYRGDYLEDDLYEAWTQPPRARLREACAAAHAGLGECLAQLGDPAAGLAACRQSLALHPAQEAVYRQVIRYHAFQGEGQQALAAYRDCVDALEAAGVEPAPETDRLAQRVEAGELRAPQRPTPHNLPQPLTSFVGRERELAEVCAILSRPSLQGAPRLLTLTGMGGTGKTRLALEAAWRLLDAFPDGVWLVELAALERDDLLPQAVAHALGLREGGDQPADALLTDHFRDRRALLLLDNCEHLVEACAGLAERLLTRCGQLRVLATSRAWLNLPGEQLYEVPRLSLPPSGGRSSLKRLQDFEAVQLFVQRARLRQSRFRLDAQSAPSVVEICRRVDGIPLAIEMAAASLKGLSPARLLAQLQGSVEVVQGVAQRTTPRHQTMRAMIDWSYARLSEVERTLLNRLSAFRGGWDAAAAEAVCAGAGLPREAVLDALLGLVHTSLVERVGERDGQPRYRLLEALRQYAKEKLAEAGETRRVWAAHGDHVLERVERVRDPLQRGENIEACLATLDAELDNVRAALERFFEGDPEKGCRLANALVEYWDVRSRLTEGRMWLQQALARQGVSAEQRAHALLNAARLGSVQGDLQGGRELAEASLSAYAALGDERGRVNALMALGNILATLKDEAAATEAYERGLAIQQRLGADEVVCAMFYNNLATVHHDRQQLDAAREMGRRALAIFRQRGHRIGQYHVLGTLGRVAFSAGQLDEAQALLDESLALRRAVGNKTGVAFTVHNLGQVAATRGEVNRARALFTEGLTLAREIEHGHLTLLNLGGLAQLCDDARRAAQLCGALAAHLGRQGGSFNFEEQASYDDTLSRARAALGEAAFARAFERGEALSLDEARALALGEAAPAND